MKHTYVVLISSLFSVLLLSGCMYPKSELAQNQIPNQAQLELVQTAVDNYREATNGMVPIKTKPNESPIFEKYLIDFSALKERQLISEVPGNAFENGGIYQYTIIDPETKALVKLIDLRIASQVQSLYVKIDLYRQKNLYPPFGKEIGQDVYEINYKALNIKTPPHIKSPYSNANLPFVIDVDGNLFIDYRIDLADALKKYPHTFKEGEDIRYILVENTPFVPAFSKPYTIKDGDPVFMKETIE